MDHHKEASGSSTAPNIARRIGCEAWTLVQTIWYKEVRCNKSDPLTNMYQYDHSRPFVVNWIPEWMRSLNWRKRFFGYRLKLCGYWIIKFRIAIRPALVWNKICWWQTDASNHPGHYQVHPPVPPWSSKGHGHGYEWSTHLALAFVPCLSTLSFPTV